MAKTEKMSREKTTVGVVVFIAILGHSVVLVLVRPFALDPPKAVVTKEN